MRSSAAGPGQSSASPSVLSGASTVFRWWCRSFGLRIDVEQTGHDLALRLHARARGSSPPPGRSDRSRRAACAGGARAVGLRHVVTCPVVGGRSRRPVDEVDAVERLVVRRARGRSSVVPGWLLKATQGLMTSRKAAPSWSHRRLDQRHQLRLSPEKERPTKVAPIRMARRPGRPFVGVGHALLAHRTLVGGGRELALGEAVDAVVHDDVGHVDAAPHDVGELAKPDRGRIAVARHAHVDQVAVGEVGAGHHRRHAAVHGVEAVAGAQEVGRRLAEQPMPESLAIGAAARRARSSPG